MVKVGDNHWYGKTVPQNITFAAEMYAEAASKNDLPQVKLVSSRKNTRRLSDFKQILDFTESGTWASTREHIVSCYVGLMQEWNILLRSNLLMWKARIFASFRGVLGRHWAALSWRHLRQVPTWEYLRTSLMRYLIGVDIKSDIFGCEMFRCPK